MSESIKWGQRVGHYGLTIRQKNKIKGYEVNYYSDMWGKSIGFVKTRKEAKEIILKHMESHEK